MKQLAGIIAVAAIAFGAWQLTSTQSADAADNGVTAPAAVSAPAAAPAPVAEPAPGAAPQAVSAPAPAAADAPSADAPIRTAQLLPAPFQEGEHFERYSPALPTQSSPDMVEVIEFFMYSCPHCYSLEPHVKKWLETKPSNVSFIRVPVSFNRIAATHVRAFYAAEALGVTDEVHEAFFQEFHGNRNRLADEKALADFFAKHGVEKEKFLETMKSFAVDSKARKAQSIAARYRIQSVPTVAVNGKFRTDGRMAGSYPRLFEIVNYLAGEEAEGQSPSAGEG